MEKAFIIRNNRAIGMDVQRIYTSTPIGVIQPFASDENIPNGYLLCDGKSYAVADYEDLYAVIGNTYGGDSTNFNVPDYRETVLVGIGENTTDTIANHDVYELGEFKDDQLQGHEHNTYKNYEGGATGGAGSATNYGGVVSTLDIVSDGTNGEPRTGTTTHGKQKGVTYIIKAFHTNEGTDSGVSDDVVEYVDNKVATKKDAVKLLNNATASTKWLKLKLGTSSTFQPIIISDQYGGKVEITGMADDGTYKSVKLVRYSYGDWTTYSATDYTLYNGVDPNYKIQRLYYYPTDGYYYLEIRQWATIKIEGNSTAELVTDLPAEKSEMTLIPESNWGRIDDSNLTSTTSTCSSKKINQIANGTVFVATSTTQYIKFTLRDWSKADVIRVVDSYGGKIEIIGSHDSAYKIPKVIRYSYGDWLSYDGASTERYKIRGLYRYSNENCYYLEIEPNTTISIQGAAIAPEAVTDLPVALSEMTLIPESEYASKSEAEKKKQVMRLPFTVSDNKFNVKYSDVLALIDKYCNFEDSGVKQNAYIPLYLTCYTSNNNTLLSCFAKFEGGIYLDRVMSSSNESPAKITRESEVNSISIELGGNPTSLFVTL